MFARFTPLESRDVPATWHVQMLSSNPGNTDATITESLIVGTAIVAHSGQTHTYTFDPTKCTRSARKRLGISMAGAMCPTSMARAI